jgi:hypothetical protein
MSSPADPYYQSNHWKALCAAVDARDRGLCVVPGCGCRGVIHDHIETRPPVPYPTEFDVLSNIRLLCRSHDSQVKERRRGSAVHRKQGGVFKVKGSDADGWPYDPRRR